MPEFSGKTRLYINYFKGEVKMKKISLKSLTAVLLITALVSTMVMIHSTAASDDFKVTYKTVLDSLNGISGPAALTDAVNEPK